MSSGVPLNAPRRSVSFTAAELADVDGVKTSFATVQAEVVLVGTDFNGAAIDAAGDTGRLLALPRTITISRSNNANQFAVLPFVMVGLYGGETVTSTVTPDDNDGND